MQQKDMDDLKGGLSYDRSFRLQEAGIPAWTAYQMTLQRLTLHVPEPEDTEGVEATSP